MITLFVCSLWESLFPTLSLPLHRPNGLLTIYTPSMPTLPFHSIKLRSKPLLLLSLGKPFATSKRPSKVLRLHNGSSIALMTPLWLWCWVPLSYGQLSASSTISSKTHLIRSTVSQHSPNLQQSWSLRYTSTRNTENPIKTSTSRLVPAKLKNLSTPSKSILMVITRKSLSAITRKSARWEPLRNGLIVGQLRISSRCVESIQYQHTSKNSSLSSMALYSRLFCAAFGFSCWAGKQERLFRLVLDIFSCIWEFLVLNKSRWNDSIKTYLNWNYILSPFRILINLIVLWSSTNLKPWKGSK